MITLKYIKDEIQKIAEAIEVSFKNRCNYS